jgi:glutamate-1-semialdehyde 2,1-aminomutase
MRVYRERGIVDLLWKTGERLASGVGRLITELRLEDFFQIAGRPCNLIYATRDANRQPSQEFRALFLRELLLRGVLAPSFVVNAAHTDADIDTTIERIGDALVVYRHALENGLAEHAAGRPVKPVFRKVN